MPSSQTGAEHTTVAFLFSPVNKDLSPKTSPSFNKYMVSLFDLTSHFPLFNEYMQSPGSPFLQMVSPCLYEDFPSLPFIFTVIAITAFTVATERSSDTCMISSFMPLLSSP